MLTMRRIPSMALPGCASVMVIVLLFLVVGDVWAQEETDAVDPGDSPDVSYVTVVIMKVMVDDEEMTNYEVT